MRNPCWFSLLQRRFQLKRYFFNFDFASINKRSTDLASVRTFVIKNSLILFVRENLFNLVATPTSLKFVIFLLDSDVSLRRLLLFRIRTCIFPVTGLSPTFVVVTIAASRRTELGVVV